MHRSPTFHAQFGHDITFASFRQVVLVIDENVGPKCSMFTMKDDIQTNIARFNLQVHCNVIRIGESSYS